METGKSLLKNNHELLWHSFACVVMLAMIVPLFFFRGNFLHMAVGVILSLCTGLLIVLERFSLKVSVVLLGVYLITAPGILFDRMELPIHNMSHMMPFAKAVTVGIFLALYCLFFILFQRISAAIAAGNILLLLVTVVEFYVNKFRGSVISAYDLRATKTAVMVMGNYDYTPSHELIFSVILFVFFTAVALKINISSEEIKKVFENYPAVKVHMASSALCAIIVAGSCFLVFKTDFLDSHGINMDKELKDSVNVYVGSLLYSVCTQKSGNLPMPDEIPAEAISLAAVNIINNFVPLHDSVSESKPNVILIMNESFSDLRVLGEMETNEPFMPFWDSFVQRDDVISGNLYVPVLGGLTVNSEYEAMTGNSLYFLPAGSIPYYTMLDKKMISLAYEFKKEGYNTIAMHPNVEHAYERNNAYARFEFDDFCGIYDFTVPYRYTDGDSGFITDECDFDELIELYKNRDKTTPYFFFNVTIQNHGGYSGDYRKIVVTGIGGEKLSDGEKYVGTDHYLSEINDTDIAFQRLIEYFEKEEEPVVICMFGDHQPILQDSYYVRMFRDRGLSETEQMRLRYITKYVIWSNYDAEFEEAGDFSANYLGAVLLDEIGLPLSEFRMYQRNLMKKLPILSLHEVMDIEGNILKDEEVNALEELDYYKAYEYRQLFGENPEEENRISIAQQ